MTSRVWSTGEKFIRDLSSSRIRSYLQVDAAVGWYALRILQTRTKMQ